MSKSNGALVPKNVLAKWSRLTNGAVTPLGTGLINATFLVVGGGRPVVLQRLHPSFDAKVNYDLDTVTALLDRQGLLTPRLVKNDDGEFATVDDDGHLWRAQTYVPGEAFDRLQSNDHAFAAGELVARFHCAIADADIVYKKERRHAHNTASHLRFLQTTVEAHRAHPRFDVVAPIAATVENALLPLADFSTLPERNCHGDLKVSNLLFDSKLQGMCLVDLDTLAPMVWPHEMGDAFRSWCNTGGEDSDDVKFDLTLLKSALDGYASLNGDGVSVEERELLIEGVRTICLELSARFLADVLNASYFGWNPDQFPTRSDHNLVRARGQLALAQQIDQHRSAAEAIVVGAFAR